MNKVLLLALVALHRQVARMLCEVYIIARCADLLLPYFLFLGLLALTCLLLRHFHSSSLTAHVSQYK